MKQIDLLLVGKLQSQINSLLLGPEMSSDEEAPSLQKDKKSSPSTPTKKPPPTPTNTGGLRQRFRLLKNKATKEGTVAKTSLAKVQCSDSFCQIMAYDQENVRLNASLRAYCNRI